LQIVNKQCGQVIASVGGHYRHTTVSLMNCGRTSSMYLFLLISELQVLLR